jgi:parallel beta-helix repeat protein
MPVSNNITIANNTIISCPFSGVNAHFSKFNRIVGNIIVNSSRGVLVGCVESTIENNTFVNVTKGMEFSSYSFDAG